MGKREACSDVNRPPPQPNSSPLASFRNSKPVSWGPPAAAGAAAAGSGGASSSSSMRSPARQQQQQSGQAARGAAPDPVADGCCDVRVFDQHTVRGFTPIHIDGDLLSIGFQTGYKLRDPGLAAARLSGGPATWRRLSSYQHGLFDFATHVWSDTGNALVWCAGDGGRRIKAFRAPRGLASRNAGAAACNRGRPNGQALQYTLCSELPRVLDGCGSCAGLHVWGTTVMAVKGSGALCTWDIADLAPAAQEHVYCGEPEGIDDSDDDSDDGGDGGGTFRAELGMREMDSEVEVTRGVKAHLVAQLQLPTDTSSMRWSSRGTFGAHGGLLREALPLCQPGGGPPARLAAVLGSNALLAYDLETQAVTHAWFGHLYDVKDLCAAPEAWAAPHLFVSAANSGDVKLWDLRMRSGAAAITLAYGSWEPVNAVVLAATAGSGSGASSSSSTQLGGGGMFCFAGGACQSVWCYDLRGGSAQALYELSTGNMDVHALAWHEGSSTLLASCENGEENRFGGCYREDFVQLHPETLEPLPESRRDDGSADMWGGNPSAAFFGRMMGNVRPQELFGVFRAPAEAGRNEALFEDEDEGGSEDGGGGAGAGGGGAPMTDGPLWWPSKARHAARDFGAYYHAASSAVLSYAFAPGASRLVPASEEVCFESSCW